MKKKMQRYEKKKKKEPWMRIALGCNLLPCRLQRDEAGRKRSTIPSSLALEKDETRMRRTEEEWH